MSGAAFQRVHLAEIEPVAVVDGRLQWLPVRRTLGIEAFGVNAYAGMRPGDEVVEEHDELGSGAGRHEELYVVLSGRARFVVGGEAFEAPTGTLVFVRDPAARRHAVALEERTIVLAVGGRAGEAYEVAPWESSFAAAGPAARGDYESAIEIAGEGLRRHPDNPSVLYNLACYEALAGRADDALAHLSRAVELEPKVRAWARDDADLASVRDDPRFAGLVAER
jgi:tetratricopeptide (TPR) repeat protein